MKICFFFYYFDTYINALYERNKHLASLSYQEQLAFILDDYFIWHTSLGYYLSQSGHEVEVIISNAKPLQQAWARENDVEFNSVDWQYSIPREQIRRLRPDIVWINSAFRYYYGEYLSKLKEYCGKIFAWIACTIPPGINLKPIDCILTSHSNFVDRFRAIGKKSEILLPAFDPRILEKCGKGKRDVSVSFVGSLTFAHNYRIDLLREVSRQIPLKVWSGRQPLVSRHLLKPTFWKAQWAVNRLLTGESREVFGIEMYKVLMRSQMTINVHAEIASGLAGNMRMFEATGMGALLLNENFPNVNNIFIPDEEIITYSNPNDLIKKIKYYFEDTNMLKSISFAGQQKTLLRHASERRSQELLSIINAYWN